jgi:hypothetical protein
MTASSTRAPTSPLILAPGAQLWLALYTHRHGTSSVVVLSDRDPWKTVPASAKSAEAWLCNTLFGEEYEDGGEEELEFIPVDKPVLLGAFAE